MSATITVPLAVPSLFHSSVPWMLSLAAKNSVPSTFVKCDGNELLRPRRMSATRRVVAGVPKFSAPLLSGGNLILTGTRGVPGGDYSILSSTNLGLPIASWTLLGSNVFDASGNFSFTNSIDPAKPQQFYLIRFLSP